MVAPRRAPYFRCDATTKVSKENAPPINRPADTHRRCYGPQPEAAIANIPVGDGRIVILDDPLRANFSLKAIGL